jgi:ubiquinone/menaquinone biosynthesis C-methylase UbiE
MRARRGAATIGGMSTLEYALARTPEEYERLSLQARVWEPATGRLFDQVGLAPGARCLDAGCGPGETMRLMAQRVGPSGWVTGIDADAPLGAQALAALQLAGHRQCTFVAADLTADEPVPGGPFDFVFARLLLFHLPERVEVLARLWDAVAPGGHLVVQDYDVRTVRVFPPLDSVEEFERFATAAFTAAGADIYVGSRLPQLFAEAGVGAPDGTDVAGRLEPLSRAQHFLTGVHNGLLAGAIDAGIATADESAAWRAALARDVERHPDLPVLWPLLIGAWKRKA